MYKGLIVWLRTGVKPRNVHVKPVAKGRKYCHRRGNYNTVLQHFQQKVKAVDVCTEWYLGFKAAISAVDVTRGLATEAKPGKKKLYAVGFQCGVSRSDRVAKA